MSFMIKGLTWVERESMATERASRFSCFCSRPGQIRPSAPGALTGATMRHPPEKL